MTCFRGLCLLIFSTASVFADFTIVSQPDIPNLSWSPESLQANSVLHSIVDFKDPLNVQFVVSLGDYTGGGVDSTSSHESWTTARQFVDTLMSANIPYAVTVGNHDMDHIPAMETPLPFERFDEYFPVADFETKPYFGGSFKNMANSYYLFTADSMDFIIVSLQNYHESAFDQSVAVWANGVLKEHAHRRAIVLTHYLEAGNSYMSQVIEKHDNIFLTLTGHHCTENKKALWAAATPSGNPIYNIRAQYQCDENIEGVPLRYYTFKPDENKIDVYTYTTKDSLVLTDSDYRFAIEYDMTVKSKPIIAEVTRYPQLPERDSIIEITALVSGNIDSATATIHWGRKSGDLGQTVPMVQVEDIFTGSIPGLPLGVTLYYTVEAVDMNGDIGVSEEFSVTVEPIQYTWNSWDIRINENEPVGAVGSGENRATVEFYESIDDDGVVFASPLKVFYGVDQHWQFFNRVQKFWTPGGSYPYVGISLTPRQNDEPKPHGVLDFQMHPTEFKNFLTCSFIIPKDGLYAVTDLGIKRVHDEGVSVSLLFMNSRGKMVSRIKSETQEWSFDNMIHTMGLLEKGDTLYFTVDRDGDFDFDAAEVSWSIHFFGTEDEYNMLSIQSSSSTDNHSSGGALSSSSFVVESSTISSSTELASSTVVSSAFEYSSNEEHSSDVESSSYDRGSSLDEASSNEEESSYDEYSSDTFDSESSDALVKIIHEKEDTAPFHITFATFSDHFHYSVTDKLLQILSPENVRTLLIVGVDGQVKTLYGERIDLSRFTPGVHFLMVETSENRRFVYSFIVY
ncbi:MAG: metallophosphoesterase [Fibrobacterales bacterium]